MNIAWIWVFQRINNHLQNLPCRLAHICDVFGYRLPHWWMMRVSSNCFCPIVFVGVCGVLVLVTAFPTPEWVVVAAYLDADCEVGVGIPTSSLPMLALGIVHRRAMSLAMSSLVWLGKGGNDENKLRQSRSSFSWCTHRASHFLVPLSCSSPPKSSVEWWWAAHIPLERGGAHVHVVGRGWGWNAVTRVNVVVDEGKKHQPWCSWCEIKTLLFHKDSVRYER